MLHHYKYSVDLVVKFLVHDIVRLNRQLEGSIWGGGGVFRVKLRLERKWKKACTAHPCHITVM
jgi:hypothetical protein